MRDEHLDTYGGDARQAGRSTPLLEWIAAGTGLVLALAICGAIAWQALQGDDGAPTLVAEVETVTQVDGGYRVEIRARNTSRTAAAQVEIEGRHTAGDRRDVETGRVVFDYLAGRSTRKGGLFFTRDPRSGSLSVRVAGYAVP